MSYRAAMLEVSANELAWLIAIGFGLAFAAAAGAVAYHWSRVR